jgi:hypothetical protein
MKVAAITLYIYAILIFGLGVSGYLTEGSLAAFVAAAIVSTFLLAAAFSASRGALVAGYAGGVGVFLLSIYFAHRLVVTERLIPNGVFLIISFMALFGLILGVFLGLQRSPK